MSRGIALGKSSCLSTATCIVHLNKLMIIHKINSFIIIILSKLFWLKTICVHRATATIKGKFENHRIYSNERQTDLSAWNFALDFPPHHPVVFKGRKFLISLSLSRTATLMSIVWLMWCHIERVVAAKCSHLFVKNWLNSLFWNVRWI